MNYQTRLELIRKLAWELAVMVRDDYTKDLYVKVGEKINYPEWFYKAGDLIAIIAPTASGEEKKV